MDLGLKGIFAEWGLDRRQISVNANVILNSLKVAERAPSDGWGRLERSAVGSLAIVKSPPIRMGSPANFDKNTFRDNKKYSLSRVGCINVNKGAFMISYLFY